MYIHVCIFMCIFYIFYIEFVKMRYHKEEQLNIDTEGCYVSSPAPLPVPPSAFSSLVRSPVTCLTPESNFCDTFEWKARVDFQPHSVSVKQFAK